MVEDLKRDIEVCMLDQQWLAWMTSVEVEKREEKEEEKTIKTKTKYSTK